MNSNDTVEILTYKGDIQSTNESVRMDSHISSVGSAEYHEKVHVILFVSSLD